MGRGRLEAAQNSQQVREDVARAIKGLGDSTVNSIGQIGLQQKGQFDTFAQQLAALTDSNERRLNELRNTVDERLKQMQSDNALRLEQMRQTVDERLTSTLEQRLGESFKQVSERLEQVHKGLGEMQTLAAGVGDLKQVLTNVKTRGTWGEVQLGMLLEQIMTPEQYATNVACKLGCAERVEFAIRLPGQPGRDGGGGLAPHRRQVPGGRLPAHARRPGQGRSAGHGRRAQSAGGPDQGLGQGYPDQVPGPAAHHRLRHHVPAHRGALRRGPAPPGPGGIRCRATSAWWSPAPRRWARSSTACRWASASSRWRQRSSEVWQLLGAVKTQFGQFGGLLEKVHKKLDQASSTIEDAARKSRTIERSLRTVQELPRDAAGDLLALTGVDEPAETEWEGESSEDE